MRDCIGNNTLAVYTAGVMDVKRELARVSDR
jgi:hypothetical protein